MMAECAERPVAAMGTCGNRVGSEKRCSLSGGVLSLVPKPQLGNEANQELGNEV